MPIRFLPTISGIFREALQLTRGRLWTLWTLALTPLVPGALVAPFVAEVLFHVEGGITGPAQIAEAVAPWTATLAVVGLVLGFIASVAATAATILVLTEPANPGVRSAFPRGLRRVVPVFWTQLLAVLAAAVAALPAVIFSWWTEQRAAASLAANPALGTFVQIVTILLFVPALIVALWYSVAVVPAARGETQGPAALAVSRRLVQGATGSVFGYFLAWILFEILLVLLLTLFFPGLTLFQATTYYLVTTVGSTALVVALYNALRRA